MRNAKKSTYHHRDAPYGIIHQHWRQRQSYLIYVSSEALSPYLSPKFGLAALWHEWSVFYCISSDWSLSERFPSSRVEYKKGYFGLWFVRTSLSKGKMSATTKGAPATVDAHEQEQPYFLGHDSDEHERLNGQHRAITLGLGALYPAAGIVRAVLAPVEGETRKILDIGCGTGVWCVEMAREFVHAEVTGIDIEVPSPPSVLPNCTFLRVDINHGFSEHYENYDLIHARFISSGIKDFRKTKVEVEQLLKPGGLIIWIDGDTGLMKSDLTSYWAPAWDGNPDGLWLARLCFETRRMLKSINGSDVDTSMETIDGGLWDDELLDPETCGGGRLLLSLSPSANDEDPSQNERLQRIGKLIRAVFTIGHKRFHPLLMKAGYGEDELNEWSKRADEELMNLSQPCWARATLAWGRRRAAPGGAAPPLPTVQVSTREEQEKYRHFYLFDNEEQAREDQQMREKSKTWSAPPMPGSSRMQT